MKPIAFLSLLVIFTGCVQENKPAAGEANKYAESLKTDVLQERTIVPDTQAVSVVNPVIPERKITVGGANADIKGYTSEAIQTAIDALHNTCNCGTVVLLPGNYDIIAPVRLYDNMSLVGSGTTTVL